MNLFKYLKTLKHYREKYHFLVADNLALSAAASDMNDENHELKNDLALALSEAEFYRTQAEHQRQIIKQKDDEISKLKNSHTRKQNRRRKTRGRHGAK
ncbi:hypothetical protein ACWA5Z_06475 [Testudinibacter sp. P80/BLE/0925]